MTLDEIKELIQLVMQTGVAELEVQRGDNRVRIRRSATSTDVTLPAAPATTSVAGVPSAPAVPSTAAAPATTEPTPPADANLSVIKAPIVGTYYDAPAPGAATFVKVGDTVQPGQVLCIIESMKLMNEIEAEAAGVIVSKLVENGKPVEYGQSLFTVRPL